ncbi:TetR/AcrR family transcriptional regulator [Mycobacterium neglectum]|jgi:AcrR family transcriptional regulator|uniref:TetR/AcrR family transcriptional regulator n=1 Tax=Mycobacterium neglectum TaxID=242737 RepID=UPI000BFED140|nr:TetR/AcrR family transcriptional regulator [Mycobacterium neglectum]
MNKGPDRPGPGRRTGGPDTKAEILQAARARFIEVGFRAATMRMIAADAGVDPALINYFFGSKQELFGEAFALRANPVAVIAEQIAGPAADLPLRLLTALVQTWDVPENRATLLAIAHAGGGGESPSLTRGFVEAALDAPVAARLCEEGVSASDARRCSAVLVTQLVGVIYARYVLEVASVAELSTDEFIEAYRPVVSAALDGCLHRPT